MPRKTENCDTTVFVLAEIALERYSMALVDENLGGHIAQITAKANEMLGLSHSSYRFEIVVPVDWALNTINLL